MGAGAAPARVRADDLIAGSGVVAKQVDGHAEVALRETPNTGRIVTMVPNGELLTILRVDGDNLKVQWKETKGWVKSGNVQKRPDGLPEVLSPRAMATPERPPAAQKTEPAECRNTYTDARSFSECLLTLAVRLVRGSYILELVGKEEIVRRRQDMPDHAFWTPEEALESIAESRLQGYKFLYCLSYRWLRRGHPDPNGHHLQKVKHVIKLAIHARGGGIALFWDFLSLLQVNERGVRTKEEQALFVAGLRSCHILYTHQLSCVWIQPVLPEGLQGITYDQSGWCCFEASISNILKPWDMRLDLGAIKGTETQYAHVEESCRSTRGPPLTPEAFNAELETRVFTNGRTDKEHVKAMYVAAFQEAAVCVETLNLINSSLPLSQLNQLIAVLPAMQELVALRISFGDIYSAEDLDRLLESVKELLKLKHIDFIIARRCISDAMLGFLTKLIQSTLPYESLGLKENGVKGNEDANLEKHHQSLRKLWGDQGRPVDGLSFVQSKSTQEVFSSLQVPKWQFSWDAEEGRWFYYDRVYCQSSWEKPVGCGFDLPSEPLSETHVFDKPLPAGWKAQWDPTKERFYFYNKGTGQTAWIQPK